MKFRFRSFSYDNERMCEKHLKYRIILLVFFELNEEYEAGANVSTAFSRSRIQTFSSVSVTR